MIKSSVIWRASRIGVPDAKAVTGMQWIAKIAKPATLMNSRRSNDAAGAFNCARGFVMASASSVLAVVFRRGLQRREVELPETLGVGKGVELDDLAMADRHPQHAQDATIRMAAEESRSAVHQHLARVRRHGSKPHRALDHGAGTVHHARGARAQRSA